MTITLEEIKRKLGRKPISEEDKLRMSVRQIGKNHWNWQGGKSLHLKRTTRGFLSYKRHKKDYCEKCGFIAAHSCQLDVDHIDGNKFNNDIKNLQTLCANCHRLKSRQCDDYKNIVKRSSG